MTELKAKNRDEIAQAYSSQPWWYDIRGFFILTFAYNNTLFSQLRFFGPNFGPEHLEVACGTGTLLDILLRWRRLKHLPNSNIIGVDYAQSMLDGAIKRFSKSSFIKLKHADAADLPFPDNSFDTINIANSLHCFPDIDGALNDVYRVLKPGGTLAVNALLYPRTCWPFNRIAQRINTWGMRKGILYSPLERAEVQQKIIKSGFNIVSESVSGNCYNILCKKK